MSRYKANINDIVMNAQKYHSAFYAAETFHGPSLYFHRRALEARHSVSYDLYLEYIYATLASWGMHRMGKGGSKMQPFEVFRKSILSVKDNIILVEKIGDHNLTATDWFILEDIFQSLNVMVSQTTIVGHSKVMAHLMPSVIPPIDREYTLIYLKGNKTIKNNIEYEWNLMKEIVSDFFIPVAQNPLFLSQAKTWVSNQSKYPWDTSILKVIDNLVIGARKV